MLPSGHLRRFILYKTLEDGTFNMQAPRESRFSYRALSILAFRSLGIDAVIYIKAGMME
jgi:hypothetical protein